MSLSRDGENMKFSYRCALALGVAALGFAPGAWAQGCVLCYTSLASSGPTAMHAFQMAMFALLIPALMLFLAVFFLIFRRARTKTPASALRTNRARSWRFSSGAKPLEGRA
jgi:hypothetical protein